VDVRNLMASTGEDALAEGSLLRQEIRQTGHELGEHLGMLRDELYRKVDNLYNPMGLRDVVSERPFLVCAAIFAFGAIWGSRKHRDSPLIVFRDAPPGAPNRSILWGSGLIGQVLVSRLLSPALTHLFNRY